MRDAGGFCFHGKIETTKNAQPASWNPLVLVCLVGLGGLQKALRVFLFAGDLSVLLSFKSERERPLQQKSSAVDCFHLFSEIEVARELIAL